MKKGRNRMCTRRFGRQAGAALIISLVILLAMTLIGVSSMDSAVLELKMAATMQQQIVALNRAEATLIEAEDDIDDMTDPDIEPEAFNFETPDDGYYPAVNALDLETADWDGVDTQDGPDYTDNGLDDDDQYVIEYLGRMPIPGETVRMDPNGAIAGGAVYTFRNTTRSASGRNAVRIVQSIYVTLEAP